MPSRDTVTSAPISMSGPKNLHIKRKATDEPPDVLVLETQASEQTVPSVRYVRQRKHAEDGVSSNTPDGRFDEQARAKDAKKEKHARAKRFFQLNRSPDSVLGKKRGAAEGVATFVEKRVRSNEHAQVDAGDVPQFNGSLPTEPLKRPSKRAAIKRNTDFVPIPEAEVDRKRMEVLAQSMHQEALEEIKREREVQHESQPKPLVTPPKLSGQRSRDVHRQRVASNDVSSWSKDVAMKDDSDYVFDTYVLAPAPTADSTASQAVDCDNELHNIGYLVITEEDKSLWETYLADELSDDDDNMDDEDENAEDYYGADYPDEELASDDEYDRGAYGFRRGGGASDDEEWDEDAGAFSDDDGYEKMMNPFKNGLKTPQQFAKYLGGDGGDEVDD